VSLFTPHPLALETLYSELKRQAFEQPFVFVGTPGSLGTREVRGSPFVYRQYYDALGNKKAEYLGPENATETKARASLVAEQIEVTNRLLEDARLLARAGYARVDARVGAIAAAMSNHGLFRGGALLVGSHAFGVLLNELGVRSAPYATSDIDIARGEPLTVSTSFTTMLEASTIPLHPVLGFDRKAAPTSYKIAGRDRLHVDLLTPTSGRQITTRAVPELDAHATAVPHLGYLLDGAIDAVLFTKESVVPVRVPRPERFAWHKALVSQLRGATAEKRTKDLHQAAVLFAALYERDPTALAAAYRHIENRKKTHAGAFALLEPLRLNGHERAADELEALLSRNKS
jgi:hypothetical protein